MTSVQICAVGIIASVAVVLLRDSNSPHPESVILVLALIAMGRAAVNVGQAVSFIGEISEGVSVSGYVRLLVKAAGLSFVTDVTAGFCKSAGVGEAAEYAELIGKTEIVVMMLPVAGEVVDIAFGMLGS